MGPDPESMMSTIAADPLALMPRGDAVQAVTTASATAGEGADFALALADVMSAEAAPAVAGDAVPVAPTAVGADGPLPLLEGLGRIAVPKLAGMAEAPAPPDGAMMPEVPVMAEVAPPEASLASEGAVPGEAVDVAVDATAPESAPVLAQTEDEVPPSVAGFPASDGTGEEAAQEDAPATDAAEEEVPVEELAQAVTVAVAAVVAAPVAPQQAPAKAKMPAGDAGSESVRMAGAGALMAPMGKPREAKGAATEAAPKERNAPEAETEEKAESAPALREKAERPEARPVARPVHAVAEHGAQPHAERRAAEQVAVKAEAVRVPDPAAGPAPLPSAAPMQAAAAPSGPVAMDRPGWEGVVTERIVAELSQDGQQIELELTPDNLGGLKIRLEVSDGQAQVRFVTETPEAARLIQQNEHRLSESLSRAGLSLGGHDSASRDAQQQQQQGDRSGQPAPRGAEIAFQRSGEPRAGMTVPRAQVGLVNLMA